jgi:hypothetical protein
MADLRRAVIGSTTAAVGAGVALLLVFFVLVEPGRPAGGCQTGLYPGTYAELVTPLHVLAFAVLCAALLALARALRLERPTAVTLGLATIYVAACLIHPPLFGPYGLVALLLLLPAAASMALVIGVLALDARRQPSAELRWQKGARAAWVGLWVTLFALLPGAYAMAWTNGAGVFCF